MRDPDMTTEEHFWTVTIEGETAGNYGPFATLEAASEFAQAHQPFAQISEFRGRLVRSFEISREEFEKNPPAGLLLDPDELDALRSRGTAS